MADLTVRDAAIIERDRLLQFSQYGAAAKLALYDNEGTFLREIVRYWNRYRRTDKDNVVFYKFKVGDLKSEYLADMKKVGDEGRIGIPGLGALYQVSKVDGYEPGEGRVYVITARTIDPVIATSFFQAP